MNDGRDTEQFSLELSQLAELDRVCDAFEVQWRTGEPPDFAEFLRQQDAALRSALLRHLLPIDIEYRRGRGETPAKAAYASLHRDFPRIFAEAWAEAFQQETVPTEIDTGLTTSAPTGRTSLVGTTIGRFRIVEELGSGGFGVVYRAHDEDLQRDVALKVAHQDESSVSLLDQVDKQLDEARVAAGLDHPAIVPVLEVGRALGGRLFIVSKFISGSNLRQRLNDFAYLPDEALRLVIAIGEALDHAHRHGLVHRDVKPANILIDQAHHPYLTDFGLALREADTGTGARFAGTPAYMSPEQARSEGHLVDARSDVFSLSVILYEMLTGQRPFRGNTREELLSDIVRAEPPAPWELVTDLSPELQRIVLRGLAGKASDRYPSAAAMVEDLRAWLEEGASLSAVTSPSARVLVQPRGLRSFDQHDAHFFRRLIPGPRDRHGIPEALVFWQRRIESRDPRHAFRLGVLYGPSGSGKSSLTRAGLIPLLDNSVLACVVRATPGDTESQLLYELQRRLPALSRCPTLIDAMQLLRSGGGMSSESKVLLVIDQFEQWLSGNSDDNASALAGALRQSDGVHVQALLLVRADYWSGLSRFLQQVEVALDADNSRLAPIFDAEHAERVLREFGEAYGRVSSEQLTLEQDGFIQNAVQEMDLRGQIVPVRLALLAEVFKHREWSPAELQRLGGVNGAVSMFLDGIVFGAAAHPRLKQHPDETVRVLRGLLPPPGSSIKGRPRLCQELSELAGIRSPQVVAEILDALSADYRLVTAQQATSDDQETSSRYQLSHDFLVPIVRGWAASRQRGTFRGRVEYLLSDRTEAWQNAEEKRSLPSLVEWLSIQIMTRRSRWTAASQRMMRAANWHYISRLSAMAVVLLITLWTVNYVIDENRARELLDRLLAAETGEVPQIIAEIRGGPRQTVSLVRRVLEKQAANPDDSRREQQKMLHLTLAAAQDAADQFAFIERCLGTSDEKVKPIVAPRDLGAVASSLGVHRDLLVKRLWKQLGAGPEVDSQKTLRRASVLAQLVPEDKRWQSEISQEVARALIAARSFELMDWTRQLGGVGRQLRFTLLKCFSNQLSAQQQENLAAAFAEFAKNDLIALIDAVLAASPKQLVPLTAALSTHGALARDELEQAFARLRIPWKSVSAAPVWESPSEDTVSIIRANDGFVGEHAGFVQSLPLARADSVLDAMSNAGFRPTSCRPFRKSDERRIAIGWRRDGGGFRWEFDLSKRQLLSFNRGRNAGLLPVDICCYGSTDPGELRPRFAATWIVTDAAVPETSIYIDEEFATHQARMTALRTDKYHPVRFFVRSDASGRPLYSALWQKNERYKAEARPTVALAKKFGNPYLGYLQTDCQFYCLNLAKRDSFAPYLLDVTRHGVVTPSELAPLAQSRLLLGRFQVALDLLEDLIDASPDNVTYSEWRVQGLAGLGKKDRIEQEVNRFAKVVGVGEDLETLKFRAAIGSGDTTAAMSIAERLVDAGSGARRAVVVNALLAQATSASDPLAADAYRDRSLKFLAAAGISPEKLLREDDFDSLRSASSFRQYLYQANVGVRYSATWTDSTNKESRLLWGLEPAEHTARCRDLMDKGYAPHSLTVRYSADADAMLAASVWHREFQTPAGAIAIASRQANVAVALAGLGDNAALVSLLEDEVSRQARSSAIQRLTQDPTLVHPLLADLLTARNDHVVNSCALRNLLIACGLTANVEAGLSSHHELDRQFREIASTTTDSGVQSAAIWCMKRLGIRDWKTHDAVFDSAPQLSYQNISGQTMIIVSPPPRFLMGSPTWEQGRNVAREVQHWRELGRPYSLSRTEVTREQFLGYLKDPKVEQFHARHGAFKFDPDVAPTMDCPQTDVRYFDAVRFCQWLSEKEGIPSAEWCYPGIWEIGDGEFVVPPDFLQRGGYRLPTEAEWEYAARAGSSTPRHFGLSDELLTYYVWGAHNADSRTTAVDRLAPNDFGFFGMLGNVREWCHDTDRRWFQRETPADYLLSQSKERILRGGAFWSPPRDLRSARRMAYVPGTKNMTVGFRVARTK